MTMTTELVTISPIDGSKLLRRPYLDGAAMQTALEEALEVMERAGGGDPRELAEVRWALARTMERAGPSAAQRRALVKAALETFQGLGPAGEETVREIRRDLAATPER